MSYQDKSLQCSDCGTTFIFSAEDQEFYQSKGGRLKPTDTLCRRAKQPGSEIRRMPSENGDRDNNDTTEIIRR